MRSNPATRVPYRVAVGTVGALVIAGGVLLIPFPGPGWLIVIGGLAILASEFEWANSWLEFTKKQVTGWTHWVGRQALWLRVVIGVLTALFVYGVFVVSLHLTGVPSWLPEWLPLWR